MVRLPHLWPRSRRAVVAVSVVLLAAVVGVIAVSRAEPAVRTRVQFVTGTSEGAVPVQLDTTLFLPAHTPAPAVLLAHGFGSTKAAVADQARRLARAGYVVLTYTARGFGSSGGLIHLDAPAYEVHDASLLVTFLSALPEVRHDARGAQIAVGGSSYGGALALLLAGTDQRIRAVGADITWNDLTHALFPNAASGGAGVFKKLWTGYLFGFGLNARPGDPTCGRFAPDICAAYQVAARTGRPTAALLELLQASSPAQVLSNITAPTLLTQGEQDSLFPLSEADANARGIAAHGTPVRVVWRIGGHDGGGGDPTAALEAWLRDVFAGRVAGRQPFTIEQAGAALSAQQGNAIAQSLKVSGYPGIDGNAPTIDPVEIAGAPQTVSAPSGGNPAAITSLPGLGSLLTQLGQLGAAGQSSLAPSVIPGQFAVFLSQPLHDHVFIAGSSSASLTVTPHASGDATLFVALRDIAPDGSQTLPSSLVAPLYLTGLRAGVATTVPVQLPSIVRDVPTGHRLAFTVSTTDFAYELPVDARTYEISLPPSTVLGVPVATGTVVKTGKPVAWLISGIALALLMIALVWAVLLRRRRASHHDASLAAVPIAVDGLVKEYGDGYRAVDGVTFRVEPGQVVGLLGPNGAGKTTTLRVLVGLITPTRGSIHVFGDPIVPGAPVLARIGAFIEGPGFLPHLSGWDNLRLYWAASGRPADEADMETALQIAGLGPSVHRKVKTYSHGMKQRLGIAQAMLGLPELLVLDEPTNGLDPPQIAEMRDVLQTYAATGRTVVVSSHLLAEVEQTCTHVVVMHNGRLVAAGSVAEIAGAGAMQLVVDDTARAAEVLAAAGIGSHAVPARRALEDVFLDLVGDEAR